MTTYSDSVMSIVSSLKKFDDKDLQKWKLELNHLP